tara:strand:+ start:869 stop:1804 length:936 start_codon:yes stop_codon:yes gene_type:complete
MKKHLAMALTVTAAPAFLLSSSTSEIPGNNEVTQQTLITRQNEKISLARDEYYTAVNSYRDSYGAYIEKRLSEKYEDHDLTKSDRCMLSEFSTLLSDWSVASDSIKFAESLSGKALLSDVQISQGFVNKMSAIKPYCENTSNIETSIKAITLDKDILSAFEAFENEQRTKYISSILNYNTRLSMHKKSKVNILISGGPAVTNADTCIATTLTHELATSQLTRDLVFTFANLLPVDTITYDGLKTLQDFGISGKLRFAIADCEERAKTRANAFHALRDRTNLPDFDEGLRSISPKAPFARTYPDPNYRPDYF